MKKWLVTNRIGQFAIEAADRCSLVAASVRRPEATQILANNLVSRRLLVRLCRDGATFVDVGAHIGSIIGGVQANSHPGRIIAVEAIPEKVLSLRRRFPGVEIVACAVGDHSGQVEFTIVLGNSGYSSLNTETRSMGAHKVIEVPMQRMDDCLPHNDVDVIKLDVEGAELGALRGAEAIVRTSRPVIMFESGPVIFGDYTHEALFSWFSDHEYDVVLPDRVAHTGPAMSMDVFLDAHAYPRRSSDFFGIPRERREEIRQRARTILK